MTEQEREELIGKMADAMFATDEDGTLRVDVMARAALAVAEPVIREQADDALREENARLRSILATKVRPPFDDDLTRQPYAAEDRQPEPGGLGRIGQVKGRGEDGGA